jgi:hypothetical protein
MAGNDACPPAALPLGGGNPGASPARINSVLPAPTAPGSKGGRAFVGELGGCCADALWGGGILATGIVGLKAEGESIAAGWLAGRGEPSVRHTIGV